MLTFNHDALRSFRRAFSCPKRGSNTNHQTEEEHRLSDFRRNNTPAQTLQIARINRKLAKDHRKVRTSRSWGEVSNLGDHYLMDIYANMVIEAHLDLD